MKKITSRDVKMFLLGMAAMFVLICIYEWKDFVDGFNEGFKGVRN